MKLSYRPEIDGLRTIAVIAVIIYHLDIVFGGTQLLKGGFLGVDIFFVISGFLITSIIMTEYHDTEGFSLVNFYERRARRLLPALFTVILVSLPVAWYLLLPSQLQDFAKSILSTLAFGSNFYWDINLQEYGAESAQLKPFLHTWTLAVEEQYYIFFPLILLTIYKWWKSHTVVILLALLLLSLQFAEYLTPIDHSFSFYMLPTRFWELLAGSLLANILYYHPKEENDTLLNKTMPVLGLYLIVHSLLFVEFESNHPGFITLLPVIGTILIIWFANKDELVTKVLSSKLFVAIGLISYALYLWHYPIFAFGRTVDASPTWHDKTQWILLTFVLSIASYFLVEKPLRDKKKTSIKIFISLTAVAVASITAFSYGGMINGYKFRVSNFLNHEKPEEIKNHVWFKTHREIIGRIILAGDSHTAALAPSLKRWALENGFDFATSNKDGCQLIIDAYRVRKSNLKATDCNAELQQKRMDFISNSAPSFVVLGGRLPLIMEEDRFDNTEGGYEGKMKDFIQNKANSLKSLSSRQNFIRQQYIKTAEKIVYAGHKLILIYPIPEVGWHVPKMLKNKQDAFSLSAGKELLAGYPITTNYDVFNDRTKSSYAVLDKIDADIRVYPEKLFCNTEIPGRCITNDLNDSFYRDDDHLSTHGAEELVGYITNEIMLETTK